MQWQDRAFALLRECYAELDRDTTDPGCPIKTWDQALVPAEELAMADRFGDVVVAMAGQGALMTQTQPNEYTLVGMHGSLTAAELTVPLLIG